MFLIRQRLCNVKHIVANLRQISSKTGPFVDLTVDNDRVATVTMQKPPINGLNLELIQELNKTLDEIAKTKAKGMILTSSTPKIFSAGLDIMELYKPDIKRLETFWSTLQDLWLKLYGFNIITAAAINGHAPAGGCFLAIACDYRVMVKGDYSIGLNEAALGIVAPAWLMENMSCVISRREAEFALTTAKLYKAEEALKVGLIDEIATDKSDIIPKCKQYFNKFDGISLSASAISKLRMRENSLNKLKQNRQADMNLFINLVMNPKVQQKIEIYLNRLKQKA